MTRVHPSLPGFLFVLLCLTVPIFAGHLMVNGDGDPARHVRHGETMLRRHEVIRSDDFSLTHAGEPFIGFEYGSQILFALGHRLGGTVGMVALTTLIVSASLIMIAAWLLRRGVEPLLVVLTTVAITALTSIHWLARPHIVSWPLLLTLFFLLESQRRPAIWAFGLLFLVWANLHGAFVLGWILIGFYIAGHVLESRWTANVERRRDERKAAFTLLPVLAVSILVTIVNPYGWQLPVHVLAFFRDPWIPRLTQEFQSPDFLRHDRIFLLSLTGGLVVLALRPRLSWTHLVVVIGTAGMALISSRNIVQFGLLAAPLLALALAQPWHRVVRGTGFVQRFEESVRTGVTAPYLAAGAVLLLGLSLSGGRIGSTQLVAQGFEPARFPVHAVEWARKNAVQGRFIHEFMWGGYLLYAWPENPVFIDGGTDHFTGALMRAHRHVMTLQPGWRDSLDTWRIDGALVITGGPIAAELARSKGWKVDYCDSTATLLRRNEKSAITGLQARCGEHTQQARRR